MQIGEFRAAFLSHDCFVFNTSAGRTLITDPFYLVDRQEDPHP